VISVAYPVFHIVFRGINREEEYHFKIGHSLFSAQGHFMKATIALALMASLTISSQAIDEVLVEGGSRVKDRTGGATRLSKRLAPDDSLQGVEGQLKGLYAQRDSIVKGLHDLGYEICMKSRIGSVDNLIEHLSQGKVRRSVVWDCPRNAKCEPPSFNENKMRVVLPVLNQPHIYKSEFKKTQIIERLLKFESRREKSSDRRKHMREQGMKIGFHRNFFHRNSCLAGAGIERACRLLSGDKKFKNAKMKRLSALMEKNPEFKLRFNKDLACKISDSKKDYIEKLKPVQEAIVEFENKLKKARKGIDDDGKLACEKNDAGIEICRLVYEEVSEDPPIANRPADDPPIANEPREPASSDLTCERASGSDVEFCFDSNQKRYKCLWRAGERHCDPY
jgi:hypothetical protein